MKNSVYVGNDAFSDMDGMVIVEAFFKSRIQSWQLSRRRNFMTKNNWSRITLDGDWILGTAKHDDINGLSIKTYADLENSGLKIIPSIVPGNVELDMERAGYLKDIFLGKNVLQLQEFEDNHYWYAKTFHYSGDTSNAYLLFEGIDTYADVFLNGKLILQADNMLIEHEIKADGLKQGENELVIHITPAVIAARAYEGKCGEYNTRYNYESLYVRKAAHMYSWDIMPRCVSAGIWKSVYIINKPTERIDDVFFNTARIDRENKTAALAACFNLSISVGNIRPYHLLFKGKCGDSVFEKKVPLWHTSGRIEILIQDVKLWWPVDAGEPNLYDITVELVKGETVIDTYCAKVGVRTVSLTMENRKPGKTNGEFLFKVNGEPLFIRGTNWVPLDVFHSRDKERMPKALELLKDINCNAVRCWGGNVYEDDAFFDYCDANGIVVWQDFAMGCAYYPQDADFAARLFVEAIAVIKRLRNHPSLIIWAGDNECDLAYTAWNGKGVDPNNNILTRKVLPGALRLYDPSRPYLPSSPYIDEECFKGIGTMPEEHLWGPRGYFKEPYYSKSTANFASEMGYHGCPSPKSLAKFLNKLWPYTDNDEWFAHCTSPESNPDITAGDTPFLYRVELMAKMIRSFFGVVPDSVERFSLASQIVQAEALKFYIELFRTQKWKRTGIMWWNLTDGWPQFSEAVADYYFDKKIAYDYVKRSQEPICLMFAEPEDGQITLMGCNEKPTAVDIAYKVTDTDNGRVVLEGNQTLKPNMTMPLGGREYAEDRTTVYLIEWEYDGVCGKNHYLSGKATYLLDDYLARMESIGFLNRDKFEK